MYDVIKLMLNEFSGVFIHVLMVLFLLIFTIFTMVYFARKV